MTAPTNPSEDRSWDLWAWLPKWADAPEWQRVARAVSRERVIALFGYALEPAPARRAVAVATPHGRHPGAGPTGGEYAAVRAAVPGDFPPQREGKPI